MVESIEECCGAYCSEAGCQEICGGMNRQSLLDDMADTILGLMESGDTPAIERSVDRCRNKRGEGFVRDLRDTVKRKKREGQNAE